jgi:hypothetical protein
MSLEDPFFFDMKFRANVRLIDATIDPPDTFMINFIHKIKMTQNVHVDTISVMKVVGDRKRLNHDYNMM